jgi:hypothetical protein
MWVPIEQKPGRRLSGQHLLNDHIFLWKLTRFKLGMDLLLVSKYLEAAITERYQLQGLDPLLACDQQFLRQTDGAWFVVSFGTIFDLDFHDVGNAQL